ncbi:MAG: hypothetical protein LWW75_08115 [Chlorobiales bacterium]|nr:hypothetical protein [Chlorobiales bacterium]
MKERDKPAVKPVVAAPVAETRKTGSSKANVKKEGLEEKGFQKEDVKERGSTET